MSEFPPSPASVPPSAETASLAGGSVQLAGWRLRLAWLGIALLTIWGVAINGIYAPVVWDVMTEGEPPFQALHVNARWQAGVPVVPQRGGVAEQAGMPEGRLVAVDGQPVSESATILDAGRLAAGPIGEPVRLSVATAAEDTVTVSIVRTDDLSPEFAEARMGWVEMWLIQVGANLLANLVMVAVAVVLLVRRGRSLVALVGAAAFIGIGLTTPVLSLASDLLNRPVDYGFQAIGGVLMFTFLVVFPDGRIRPRWAGWLPVAAFVVWMSMFLPVFATALRLPPFFAVSFAVLTALAVWAQTIRYRETTSDDQRMQTRWAFLGTVLGLAFGIVGIVIVVLPAAEGSAWYWWRILVGSSLSALVVLFPIGIAVSLLRYRLWDAEAAWSRSAMAAALTLALTAIIAGGTALTQSAFGASGPLSLALATAAAAVFFVPLQRRLADWADHRFLRDLTDLKEKLPDLVGHLRETESIEGIAEAVTDRIAPAVHAAHVALVVPIGEGWQAVGTEGTDPASVDDWTGSAGLSSPPAMAPRRRQPWRAVVWRDASDRQFPVRVALRAERGGGEIATEGWLLLGPRPDGSGYGPDDLEAIAQIAGPVGRALQVVRVRQARDAAQSERAETLAESLRQLREDLARGLREFHGESRTGSA